MVNIRHDMVYCFAVRPAGPSHELLQVRRHPTDYLGGTWQTVVGTIEPGETAAQAALRELREETGLAPVELYQLDTVNSFYVATTDTMFHCPGFCAIVAPDASVILNAEHDQHRWLPRSSAAEHFLWPGDRAWVVELCRTILNDGPAKPYLRL